ncbi:MAG: hypothetical protein Q8P40_06025, partial [Nitrospirota bacterium]|nr:hypothetical protein [Nitrospirota bacterium]
MLIRSSLVKPHDSVIPAKAGIQEKQRKTRFPLKDYWNDRNISHVLLLMVSLVICLHIVNYTVDLLSNPNVNLV